jgi:hypothetical protein
MVRTLRSTPTSRVAALAAAVLLAAALLAAGARPAAALPSGPAPVQTDCLGWQGPGKCVYNIGFIEFRLSKRVLHVGETVTGTYTWGLSETRSGRFLAGGQGLRLLRCGGDRVAGLGSSGSRTCTWKAVRPTGDWVTDLGMTLFQNASLGAYTENDFYVVLGREHVIEGKVTRQETEGNPTSGQQGIPGVTIRIHGPQSKTVRTNANGYYAVRVRESGRYRVTPTLPRRYGGRRALTPTSRVVAPTARRAARADFRVDDDLTVQLRLDRERVPATGLELVTGTVEAERFGQPVAGLYVSVIPFRRVATNAETVPVPAHFCVNGGIVWPTGTRGLTTNHFPFDIVTDDTGQARFVVQPGTVPGSLPIQVWAKDGTGRLRLRNVTRVSDTRTLVNEPTGALGPAALPGELATMAGSTPFTFDTNATALATELAEKAPRGLAYAPVSGARMYGVLVVSASERPAFQGVEGRVGANGGLVIPAAHLNPAVATGFGGFAGALRAGQLPELPTFAQFEAGAPVPGWSLNGPNSPVRLSDDLRGWRYLGFPYPKPGGC